MVETAVYYNKFLSLALFTLTIHDLDFALSAKFNQW